MASAAGRLWGRLSAADFFGHSFQLSALAFLCFFPFLLLSFSAAIVANDQKYGPVGVVMVILSRLVAVGVVIHLGAVVGREYAEHRAARSQR